MAVVEQLCPIPSGLHRLSGTPMMRNEVASYFCLKLVKYCLTDSALKGNACLSGPEHQSPSCCYSSILACQYYVWVFFVPPPVLRLPGAC